MLDYHTVAESAAFICFILALVWLLAPKLLLSIWGIAYSSPVGIVSRRGAALFLCIGLMIFLSRNAVPSPARDAISIGFSAGCLALASLGSFEFLNKRAKIGIFSAVIVEVILAIAFIIQI